MGANASSPKTKQIAVPATNKICATNDETTINSSQSIKPLEDYFQRFRFNTCGFDSVVYTSQGRLLCVYADWTASGRCYEPIERKIGSELSHYVANTHTETSALGHLMTSAYKKARATILQHVNASKEDILLAVGSGMTGAVSKLQSILGLRIPEKVKGQLEEEDKPVVFITHYEHHSNQISWENCFADVIIVPADDDGKVSPKNFEATMKKYKNYKEKYVAISACSNVTGIRTPFHEIAKIAHQNGAYCFVDFATSFGYVEVDMHPSSDPMYQLDAIYFSPHKLLGGPGSCGICIFNKKLYKLEKPDICGGGTVNWTNPWGEQGFTSNIEEREDAGTPPFLQLIKASLAILLKEEMGVKNMLAREAQINTIVFKKLGNHKTIHILAGKVKERLSIFSIYIDDLHYNLLAKLLNDYYGIQCRGGCNCAGTYGHVLFGITKNESKAITDSIDRGDNSTKPGWCRISFHPTMSNTEVIFVCDAVLMIAKNFKKWKDHYKYDSSSNQFISSLDNNDWVNKTVENVFSKHHF